MLEPSLELARKLERADARVGQALVSAFVAMFPKEFSNYCELGGGVLYAVGGGTPVTQIVGMGLDGEVSERDLERLIALLDMHYLEAEALISDFAGANLCARLCKLGFREAGRELSLARQSTAADREPIPPATFSLHGMHPRESELWARTVAAGYNSGRAGEGNQHGALDAMLATTAADGFLGFLVRMGSDLIGAGGMLCSGEVASLFGHTTKSGFRRLGVQGALLRHSLAVAAERGIELIKLNTPEHTTSLRNAERAGFRRVDMRTVLVRPRATQLKA